MFLFSQFASGNLLLSWTAGPHSNLVTSKALLFYVVLTPISTLALFCCVAGSPCNLYLFSLCLFLVPASWVNFSRLFTITNNGIPTGAVRATTRNQNDEPWTIQLLYQILHKIAYIKVAKIDDRRNSYLSETAFRRT